VSAALYDTIARIARHEVGARATAAVGRVCDVFASAGAPPDHAVSVELRDEGLVLPRVPIAVGALGFAATMRVDDLVVVLFLDGDVNAPIVVGRLYHADLAPPEHADGDIVLRIPAGAQEPEWSLLVSESKSQVQVLHRAEPRLTLTADTATVTVGEMTLQVTSAGGGRAELAAGGAKLTIKPDGDITLSTSGKLTLKGSEVEISAAGSVKVKGATVELN
jgi:uncharacterized protein involved in type VI secretion and phage assembly